METNNIYQSESGVNLINSICLVDSHAGQYIPMIFAEHYGQFIPEGENKQSLLNGPDDEWYNEAWDTVEQNTIIEIDGKKYSLLHDGDLFAIPVVQ